MADNLVIFGHTYNGVEGFKATDTNNNEITYTPGSSAPVLETLNLSYTPSETAISDTQTPSTGYDGFDEVNVSVSAISSSYVGSGITRRDSTDMSVSGDTVTAPAGYYENTSSKSVPAGSVTSPATITGTNADKVLGSGRLALQKAVNVTPVVSTPGYVNAGTAGESTVLLASDIIVESAQDYHPSTQDQTIASNKYLYGAQTIKGVLLTNLLAENIKSGVTVKVGDDSDDDCVAAVTGTLAGSGKKFKSGTYTPSQTYNSNGNRQICTISDIGFTPSMFMLFLTNRSTAIGTQYAIVNAVFMTLGSQYSRIFERFSNTSGSIGRGGDTSSWTTQTGGYLYLNNNTVYYRTSTSYILPANKEYTWYAYE